MQDNTKNLAAMPSPRTRTTQVLMSALNADGMDGENATLSRRAGNEQVQRYEKLPKVTRKQELYYK